LKKRVERGGVDGERAKMAHAGVLKVVSMAHAGVLKVVSMAHAGVLKVVS